MGVQYSYFNTVHYGVFFVHTLRRHSYDRQIASSTNQAELLIIISCVQAALYMYMNIASKSLEDLRVMFQLMFFSQRKYLARTMALFTISFLS